MSDRELVICDEAGENGCIQHGTHFGVREIAVREKEVTDGYHSFEELYDHRRALTAVLAALAASGSDSASWKSKRHHPEDDPMFEGGYFIVGIHIPNQGPITYHYKLTHWDDFAAVPELEHAPRWDGATPADTVTRLLAGAQDLANG
jgi:hypothetical protein